MQMTAADAARHRWHTGRQSAQNIPIEHEVHQTDKGNARFVRVERLNAIHNDDFPEGITNLAESSCFLFNLVRTRRLLL